MGFLNSNQSALLSFLVIFVQKCEIREKSFNLLKVKTLLTLFSIINPYFLIYKYKFLEIFVIVCIRFIPFSIELNVALYFYCCLFAFSTDLNKIHTTKNNAGYKYPIAKLLVKNI